MDGYLNLANQIIGNEDSIRQSSNDNQPENNYRVDELSVVGSVSGYGLAAINGEFANKVEAIEAADNLLNYYVDTVAWRDENVQSLGFIDTPEIEKICEYVGSQRAIYNGWSYSGLFS